MTTARAATLVLGCALLALSCDLRLPIERARGDSASPPARSARSAPPAAAEAAAVPGWLREAVAARCLSLDPREQQELAEALVRQSLREGLPATLVWAVIEVESGCRPGVVSRAGAIGLMQLLPSTAAALARRHGLRWSGVAELFDPVRNLELGTAYLRELIDRYRDPGVALAAYNWGPTRIDARLARGAPVPRAYAERVLTRDSAARQAGQRPS